MPNWQKEISDRLADLKIEPAHQNEIIEELAQHLEDRYQEHSYAGLSAEEAQRITLNELNDKDPLIRKMGRLERSSNRESVNAGGGEGGGFLTGLWHDVRYASRLLLKDRLFTVVAVLTLALGIGVNSALFTVYDAFVLKPLPLKDPNSIASITGYDRDGKRNRLFSYLDYLDYRDRNTAFAGLIAWNQFTAPFGDLSVGEPDSLAQPASFGVGHLVSGNYFSVLGADMTLGRGFVPEEDRTPGTHPVMVLSHICWSLHFKSDPNIVGKTVHLAGLPFTIIGVTAPGFIGVTPDAPQFWVPLMMRDQLVGSWNHGQWLTERRADSFVLTGRLKLGTTTSQAQADMNLIAAALASDHPDPQRKASIRVSPGATFIQLDDQFKPLVAPILTAVGLLLLMACVNVTNMLLARAVGRQREMAVRLAMGASRMRVVRQLLTESVLLGTLGGATGLLLAIWAIRVIYPLVLAQLPVPPAMLEQFAIDLSPDYRVFSFGLFVSLLAGMAAGLTPALQSSRPNLSGALKNEGSTFGAQLNQSRLRSALVVMQIAVCLTLLIAAALLTRNMRQLQTIETGLVARNVFTLNVSTPGAEPGRVNEFYRQLANRLRALPGVKSVSQAQRPPFAGPDATTSITIAGQPPPNGRPLKANYNFVSADYFQTLGLRLTRGRAFTQQETEANARVVVISESTAHRFWPNENPIGKYIGLGVAAPPSAIEKAATTTDATPNFPQYEIIGLTNDTRQGLIWRPDETFLYVPLPIAAANQRTKGEYLIVSTEGDAHPVMTAAYKESVALEPNLPVLLNLVDDLLALQMTPFRDLALLSGVLGALALLLASIGLYGVMSFIVSRGTREIGIRMALGAQSRDCVALFLRRGVRLIAVGVTVGLAGGAAISSLLAAALTDISQFDPLAFGAVAALLSIIALSACYLPARRATKVDPLVALRHE